MVQSAQVNNMSIPVSQVNFMKAGWPQRQIIQKMQFFQLTTSVKEQKLVGLLYLFIYNKERS
jgi:hypothetical protein